MCFLPLSQGAACWRLGLISVLYFSVFLCCSNISTVCFEIWYPGCYWACIHLLPNVPSLGLFACLPCSSLVLLTSLTQQKLSTFWWTSRLIFLSPVEALLTFGSREKWVAGKQSEKWRSQKKVNMVYDNRTIIRWVCAVICRICPNNNWVF